MLLLTSKHKKTAFAIFAIPAIIQAQYFEIYNKLISSFDLKMALENPLMVSTLWLENIDLLKLLIIILVFATLLKYLNPIQLSKKIISTLIFFLVGLFGLIILSWYSIFNFQNSIVAFYGSIFDLIKTVNFQTTKLNKPDLTNFEFNSTKNLPNIIYIVGESAVFGHTSIGNYSRNTTPNLKTLEDKNIAIFFKNAVSIGTKTRLSVPYMLVGLEGKDPEGKIYQYPNILNYAKRLGYKTIFITSQDLNWGELKDLLIDKDVDYFVNGTKYNPNASVHKGTDDLVMINKELIPIIRSEQKPFFIVYQMDGSHYPYSLHSPKEFKKWKEDNPNSINSYDNTLIYSDFVLKKLIDEVRSNNLNSWVFYSSDHGQHLEKNRTYFNNSFAEGVIHNFLFVVPPKKYINDLKKNINSPVSQADIVKTILDIWNIQPVKKLDGYSLLKKIPSDRLRTVSNYMPTLHNDPESVLVFPDLTSWYINFENHSVTFDNEKTVIPYEKLEEKYKLFLEK